MNYFSYTSDFCNFSFQSYFILLIFHGTMLYSVTVLFDVSDAPLKHPAKDVLTFQKQTWLRNRYVWSVLVLISVVIIIAVLAITLSEAESKNTPPSKAQL
jgi:hypothetical protein